MLSKLIILVIIFSTISCNKKTLEIGKVEVWDLALNHDIQEIKFYFLGLQSLGVDYKVYLSNYATSEIKELELENIEGYDIKFITLESSLLIINSIKVDIQNVNMVTIMKNYGLEYCLVSFDEMNSKIDVHIISRISPPNLYMTGDEYLLKK